MAPFQISRYPIVAAACWFFAAVSTVVAKGQGADAVVPESAKDVRVRVDGKSIPLTEVVRQKSADAQQRTYREMRVSRGGTAEGQLELARWCRKQKMADEERLHWWSLLAMQPGHPEAIKGLQLRKFQGLLVTSDEIDQLKRQKSESDAAAKRWVPKLKKIKQAIERGEAAEREAAVRELKSIRDPLALPSIEAVFGLDHVKLGLELVELAKNVPGGEGAALLMRLAVDAPDAYVREKAAEALKERPYPTYVPMLIAGLAAPIELSFTKSVQQGGPEFERVRWYEYTGRLGVGLYDKYRLKSQYTNRDVLFWGPEVRHKSGLMMSGYHPDRVQYNYQLSRESSDPAKQYEYAGTLEGDERSPKNARKAPAIEDLDKRVKEINEKQARLNERIDAALSKATGVEVESQQQKDALLPQRWWEWWRRHSGMNRYFARGTEVWTQTGPVAIEQILVGDRVLSRDPKSGDLSFRLVIGIGEQAQGEMRIVDVDARTIVATPDQPFMVAGAGWRNAVDLKVGVKLEGLGPARSIGAVRAGDGANMYNLIVADMPNFFVDRSGILVHDASSR